jgi:hypothetical protein
MHYTSRIFLVAATVALLSLKALAAPAPHVMLLIDEKKPWHDSDSRDRGDGCADAAR